MRPHEPITNDIDILDTRDIQARIRFLEISEDNEVDMDEDEADELAYIRDVIESIGTDAASEGITLIRDGYFQDYTEEYARDMIGDKIDDWPMTCIDWDAAGNELKSDYSCVDFGDETYWYRS